MKRESFSSRLSDGSERKDHPPVTFGLA